MAGKEHCIDDEIPFDIPNSWQWVRLTVLCKSIADGDHQPPPQTLNGVPFLVISDVSSGETDFSRTRFVPQSYFDALAAARKPQKNDILFTVTGSYGIVVPVRTDIVFCFQRHIALLKPCLFDSDFLSIWLSTPLVFEQCKKAATGTAQKTVGINALKNILIPVPPQDEQLRIKEMLKRVLPLTSR